MTTGAESEGMFLNSTIKDIQNKTSKLGTKFYFSTREIKYSYEKYRNAVQSNYSIELSKKTEFYSTDNLHLLTLQIGFRVDQKHHAWHSN